jgi:hypothetical protein
MKLTARVVQVESGAEWSDGERRVTLKIDGSTIGYDRIKVRESVLGVRGPVMLDDTFELNGAVTFPGTEVPA